METGGRQTEWSTRTPPARAQGSATHAVSASRAGAVTGQRERAGSARGLGRLTVGGSEGNEQLTAIAGAILIVLLAVIGVTILHLHSTLLSVHLFVGLLLIGPVVVKLASTGYRFMRYYTHNPRYRSKGPPPAYLRAIAPIVVLSTIVVFASGVALLLIGPSSHGALLPVHKVSFIVWVAFTGVHVLGHLPEVQRALSGGGELRSAVLAGAASAPGSTREMHDLRAGRAGRTVVLAVGFVLGLVLALALIPQFGPWLSYHRVFPGH
jgi:hypothetical protein